jgi:hypothetical protein
MKKFLAFCASVKRWWQWRFRGYVAAPARSGGTSWQQHRKDESFFICGNRPKDQTFSCGQGLVFTEEDYVIRSQEHDEDCEHQFDVQPKERCQCPVTDARYIKICPQCGLGHWKQA